MRKSIVFVLMFMVLVKLALGLGAMPAQTSFYGDGEHSGKFFVIPSSSMPTKISTNVQGDLDIDIIGETVIIGQKELNFTLTGPFEPGEHKAKIIISEEPLGTGTVVGKASVHHTVNLFMPYPEEYLETGLLIIDENPYLLKFTTIMNNRGALRISDIENEIDIYDNEDKIATLYKAALLSGDYDIVLGYGIQGTTEKKLLGLPRRLFSIEPGDSYENQLIVKKFLFEPGEYELSSMVRFSEEVLEETGMFRIGDESISFYLETETAMVNRINRFILVLNSNWNKELEDVNISAEIFRNNSLIASLDKQIVDIDPEENTTVRLHWDVEELELGSYELRTKAYYKDQTFEDEFMIELMPEKARVPPIVYVMIALIVIAIALMIMLKKLKKKGKKKTKKRKK